VPNAVSFVMSVMFFETIQDVSSSCPTPFQFFFLFNSDFSRINYTA